MENQNEPISTGQSASEENTQKGAKNEEVLAEIIQTVEPLIWIILKHFR